MTGATFILAEIPLLRRILHIPFNSRAGNFEPLLLTPHSRLWPRRAAHHLQRKDLLPHFEMLSRVRSQLRPRHLYHPWISRLIQH